MGGRRDDSNTAAVRYFIPHGEQTVLNDNDDLIAKRRSGRFCERYATKHVA